MASVRHMLLSLLAVLGLLSALAWEGTALACPSNSVAAAPKMRGCEHAPMPSNPRPVNHEGQICSSLCFGVLPSPSFVEVQPPLAFEPSLARLQALSGIDPGLDPPPPRAA